ncbi:hypothetical protein NA56DRAFT_646595 [Hyaloscypha hepaticicola]|uniref:Trypsin-like serine protease n=1 Tax=Hyaloscypha hepaticicola TaxID=2082293 RepID=A0A2J6Q199_9HELO|nr:hypothetical protein NA56DRAFT_646595 [Hyaloscypha hepaticicola]
MPGTTRTLRSAKLIQELLTASALPPRVDAAQSPIIFTSSSTPQEPITHIPLNTKLPHLKPSELTLLRKKQAQLSSTATFTLTSLPKPGYLNALLSTLIFAQREAGTAVCIHPAGWLLTCAHCFGDDAEDYEQADKRRWLLLYTGEAVLVECRVWDVKRDLALLKVIAIESTISGTSDSAPIFTFLKVDEGNPRVGSKVLCIGQPGRDDLEAEGNRKTKYNLIEVSEGRFRGMVKEQDSQDNGEIGSLMHDAWTYWGHSGAPLISAGRGSLVGLHSSWDDQTAMRHGIPGVAVREFLKEHLPEVGDVESAGTSVNPIEVS